MSYCRAITIILSLSPSLPPSLLPPSLSPSLPPSLPPPSLIHLQLGLQDTLIYQLNGALLVVVFFLVRIANTPLVLLLYSAQHHNWDFFKALSSMRLICHFFLAGEFVLQIYWFMQLLRIGIRQRIKIS